MSTIESYLRDVSASLRASEEDKRLIVDELRTHLVEKVKERAATDPAASRAEVEASVVAEFGDARELALAYSPEGDRVLRNSTGEIVLRVGDAVGRGARYVARHGPAAARAVGRGTTKVLKWTAISLAVVLVVSLGVGAWAYYEVKPYIPAIIEQSQPAFSYDEVCRETPCNGAFPAGTFFVGNDTRNVRLEMNVYPVHPVGGARYEHVGNGSFHMTVVDPNGATVYERTFNMTEDSYLHYETTWAAVPGTWTILAEYADFVGAVQMETRALVLPWGDER